MVMSSAVNLLMNIFPIHDCISNHWSIQGSSREKIYQELSLEHLHQRWWMKRLYLFYKAFHNKVPRYIHSLISSIRTSARLPNTFTFFYCRIWYFPNSFLSCVNEWTRLDKRSCLSDNSFCKPLLNFVRPSENKIFNIVDQVGIELLIRLRLGVSHLHGHKFWHNF